MNQFVSLARLIHRLLLTIDQLLVITNGLVPILMPYMLVPRFRRAHKPAINERMNQ